MRHRHHTLTFEQWQQQKYTIERNQNDALCNVCVNVYLSESKPLWMCMRMYLTWNLELNEMRDEVTVKENLPKLKQTRYGIFLIALNNQEENFFLWQSHTNEFNYNFRKWLHWIRLGSAAIKMCYEKKKKTPTTKRTVYTVHVSSILSWFTHTNFPFAKV